MLSIPYLFRCGHNKKEFSKKQIKYPLSSSWFFRIISIILKAYKSQINTWIFLLPALIISRINKSSNVLIYGNDFKKNDIEKILPKSCLYEVRKKCLKEEWQKITKIEI